MKNLTDRQYEILTFIVSYIESHKFPPTLREIANNFEFSAKAAHDHLKALEKKKYIQCDNKRSRAIEVLKKNRDSQAIENEHVALVPLLGNVAAGLPLLSEENFDGRVEVPLSMLSRGNHFALNVRGDSMINAGVLDGDLALFLQQPVAENGEIVVAMVDEAVTLKRFYKEKNRIKLKAENPAYPPIYTQRVRVLGKLVCVIRTYE